MGDSLGLLGEISDWNLTDWWEMAKKERETQGWPVRVILWENSFWLKAADGQLYLAAITTVSYILGAECVHLWLMTTICEKA